MVGSWVVRKWCRPLRSLAEAPSFRTVRTGGNPARRGRRRPGPGGTGPLGAVSPTTAAGASGGAAEYRG